MNFFKMLSALFGTLYRLFNSAHISSMALEDSAKVFLADSQAKYRDELKSRDLTESDIEGTIAKRKRELAEDGA